MGQEEKYVNQEVHGNQTGYLPSNGGGVADEESVYVTSTTDLHRRLNNRQVRKY